MDDHWFGLTPPNKVTSAWGARAIYKHGATGTRLLDFLPDRQSYTGDKIPKGVFKELVTALQHAVARTRPDPGDDRVYVAEHPKHPGWGIRFNPKMSHGYMYCLIWKV